MLHEFVFVFASCNISSFVKRRLYLIERITQNIRKLLNCFSELHSVPLDCADTVFYQPFKTNYANSVASDFLRLFFRKCYVHVCSSPISLSNIISATSSAQLHSLRSCNALYMLDENALYRSPCFKSSSLRILQDSFTVYGCLLYTSPSPRDCS